MKPVDITLLIQALNFFITYLVLRRYVFSPAAQILEAEELQGQLMQCAIKESLEQKSMLTIRAKDRLLEIKQLLQGCIPVSIKRVLQVVPYQHKGVQQEPVSLSEQQRQQIKKIISDSVSEVTL